MDCRTRSKMSEAKMRESTSGPPHKPAIDLFEKEMQYKLRNAEVEAKTADLARQAEEVLKNQNDVLSNTEITLNHLDINTEEEKDSGMSIFRKPPLQQTSVKGASKNRAPSTPISQNRNDGNQRKERTRAASVLSRGDDMTTEEKVILEKVIHSLEEQLDDPVSYGDSVDEDPSIGDSVGQRAQVRVLEAKLRVMQEEMDRLSYEYREKDDENNKLGTKLKVVEEDRAKLQKTTNTQQTQIEKHRALVEESNRKCECLQVQIVALQKEIQSLNKAQKQAACNQNAGEVRLNRALEEVERLKSQLNKTKQMNQDKIKEEQQSRENILAENKMLKKQKAELILGFRKQLCLIDILKRQKMHFEAAKMLSFTEEEFMKALDWGMS